MFTFLFKLTFFSLIIISLTISITTASEQYNKIDAFTSASIYRSLKIEPSKVYKDSAVILWEEDWKDELKVFHYKIKWGTTDGVYTDSINLKPFTPYLINTVVVKPLQPNTLYFAQIQRDYDHKNFNRNFRFNTPPLPTVDPIPLDDPGRYDPLSVKYASKSPKITLSKEIREVDIFTMAGKRVSQIAVNLSTNTLQQIHSSLATPGVYIVFFKNGNQQIISSEKAVINK